jgi:carboxypeptidase C (cathepsin A)
MTPESRSAIWLVAVVAFFATGACRALERPTPTPADAAREAGRPSEPATASSPVEPLPAAVQRSHEIEVQGRKLGFDTITGAVEVLDGRSGKPEADVAFVAFLLKGGSPATRPLTFAINGGPGAGSAWLNLGAMGPWRITLDGWSASAPPRAIDNADTWLDFTDLVFLDPPGTGYSRMLGKDDAARRHFYSVEGDLDALAIVIRKWLTAHNRLESPKFLVGESYGGFRAPKLARRLQDHEGVGLRGIVLVSPVLDFGWLEDANDPMIFVARLPSQAAIAHGSDSRQGRAAASEAEAYAAGSYLTDLLRGQRDEAALDRIAERVAWFTGLEPALVRRLGGRIDLTSFARERERASGKVSSLYDGRIGGFDAAPMSARGDFSDPVLDTAKTVLASAMTGIMANRLGWKLETRYEILNEDVSRHWDWGGCRCRAEAFRDLKRVLALDPEFRVLVAHGLSDLVTPYFATKLLLDQMPPMGRPDRFRLELYDGGHMFYFDDKARAAFREAGRRLVQGR